MKFVIPTAVAVQALGVALYTKLDGAVRVMLSDGMAAGEMVKLVTEVAKFAPPVKAVALTR